MSKLDELIAELCPKGVEFKPIKDEYTRLKGTPITAGKMKEIANPNGEIRIFAGGKTVINAREEDIPKANITRVPAVLVQSRGVIDFVYYEEPFTFKNEMWAYTHKEKVSVRYLFHVLKNNVEYFRESASGMGSLPQISLPVTEDFKIPVPPLEVQREIVRVLDSFTLLTAELTAELTARKSQYDFYRDKLLTFGNDIPMLPLKDVVKKSCAGATPAKGNAEYYEGGTIPWIRTQDVRFNEITEVDSFITEKAVEETAAKWIPENCVIVAISGATAGRCAINKIKATTNQHCLNMQIDAERALYKYVYYCICSKQDELISKKQGARGDLNSSLILGTKIPVPRLEIQKKIVHVLDNFESICTDLNIGLPAEIEARQKQYEYYRDLLLTFAETGNTLMTDRQTELSAIKLIQYVFGVAYIELGKIAEITDYVANGSFASLRENVSYKNESDYAALIRTADYSSGFDPEKMVYIDEHAYEFLSKSKLFGGEIIINNIGAGVGTTFRCPFLDTHMSLAPNAVMVKTENDSFYYFWFRSKWGQDAIRRIVGKSAMPKFNKTGLRSIIVPVPTKEVQDKIVAVLEKFESLCNDLSSGLPAEIEARQKQYEYYRDKLLSFEEKN